MLSLALLFAPFPLLVQDEVTPVVPSSLEEVVVYPQYALVRRSARLPGGGGAVAIRDLPDVPVADLRLRLEGGEVIRAEVVHRPSSAEITPEEVEARRAEIHAIQRETAALDLRGGELDLLTEHLRRLMREAETVRTRTEGDARPVVEMWTENLAFLTERLEENRLAKIDLRWRREDLEERRAELETSLDRARRARGERVRELVLDTLALVGGPQRLEIEYAVASSGWQPAYDLRVADDLSGAELVYRARVWQQSGEDWEDASIVLSTLPVARAAKGPLPGQRPVTLHPPEAELAKVEKPELALKGVAAPTGAVSGSGFAAVGVEGTTVRFHLSRRETIPSRKKPTHVLVGRATVEVEAEHYCVPAFDPTVWLRARVVNTSDWAMLPGGTSVSFGRQFVGEQGVGMVPVGGELVLHLGPDPGVVVERTRLSVKEDTAGFMGTRDTLRERWRISVRNESGKSSRADGAVRILLRDTMPQPGDERIQVKVEDVSMPFADDPIWIADYAKHRIATWWVEAPAGEKVAVDFTTRLSYPTGWQVALD